MKDAYIDAHEQLIAEYMEAHPGVSWDEAYDLCADGAYNRMQDSFADRADSVRQRLKDEGF